MGATRNPGFFSAPQRAVTISAGVTRLPCHFRQVHYAVALFTADLGAMEAAVREAGLQPALRLARRGVAAMGAIRYADSDLGAYDEMILSIPSVPAGRSRGWRDWADLAAPLSGRRTGQYILHIPVTEEFSRAAGVELWGFPKTVLPVVHAFGDAKSSSTVHDEEGLRILTLSGSHGLGIPVPPLDIMTYSLRSGERLRTHVHVRGWMRLHPFHGMSLEVGPSSHPMAEELRRLGLQGRRPFAYLCGARFQAAFDAGVRMGPDWEPLR